jgi:hypothetical protein
MARTAPLVATAQTCSRFVERLESATRQVSLVSTETSSSTTQREAMRYLTMETRYLTTASRFLGAATASSYLWTMTTATSYLTTTTSYLTTTTTICVQIPRNDDDDCYLHPDRMLVICYCWFPDSVIVSCGEFLLLP